LGEGLDEQNRRGVGKTASELVGLADGIWAAQVSRLPGMSVGHPTSVEPLL